MMLKAISNDIKKCISIYFVLFTFCLSNNIVGGSTIYDVERILKDVFDSSKYNKLIRGQINQTEPMNVTVGMTLKSIVEVHEIKEYVHLLSVIHITWHDDRLMWNSSDYNDTDEVFMPGEVVWHPEIYVEQASQEQHMIGDIARHPIYHKNTGQAIWTTVVPLMIACSFDLTSFPWDIQTCKVHFMVWGYQKRHIHVHTSMSSMNMDHYVENSGWDFVSSSVHREDHQSKSGIAFQFVIRRRPEFFIINIFLPILSLSLMSSLVFAIPIESGERIAFSLTTLLSVVLFMTMISSGIPQSAETMPSMCYFLFAELVKSVLACACNILSLKYYNTTPDEKFTGKHWRKLASIFRTYPKTSIHKKIQTGSYIHGSNQVQEKDMESGTVAAFDTVMFEISWKDVSKTLDRLFVVVMVLFSLACYITMAYHLISNW